MKLTIFAILLLLGGFACLAEPENILTGVICILIGIVILAFKFASHSGRKKHVSRSSSVVYLDDSDNSDWNRDMVLRNKLTQHDEAYKAIVDKHYKLLNEIRAASSRAYAAGNYFSPLWDKVIKLCEQDIALAEPFKKWYLVQQQYYIDLGYTEQIDPVLPSYPSFVTLSRIYERQENFENAISICEDALSMGYTSNDYNGGMAERLTMLRIQAEYHTVMQKHKQALEGHAQAEQEAGVLYSVCDKAYDPADPNVQKLIDLCMLDIQLAPAYKIAVQEDMEIRKRLQYKENTRTKSLTQYTAFKRLAVIYEKQKEYEKAIQVCQAAIELGFVEDGTAGQMQGRLARLTRKNGNNIKIKSADVVVVDDETGEIID